MIYSSVKKEILNNPTSPYKNFNSIFALKPFFMMLAIISIRYKNLNVLGAYEPFQYNFFNIS